MDLIAPESLNWYAIYTTPKSEKKIASHLVKFGIETFLPIVPRLRIWSDRKKTLEMPLFPSYLFVRIEYWKDRNHFYNLPGFVRFVFENSKVAVFPENDIETVKIFVKEYPDTLEASKLEMSKPGTELVVKSGSFKGKKVVVIKKGNSANLLVRFPSLGAVASVSIPIDDLGFEES